MNEQPPKARRFADRIMGVEIPDQLPDDIESLPSQPVTGYSSMVDRVAPYLENKD